MSLTFFKIAAAITLFLTSMIAALFPINAKTKLHSHLLELGEAFASGVFLGAAFFHLLPHAQADLLQVAPYSNYPLAEAICIASFLFFIFLERLAFITTHTTQKLQHIPYILTLILIIHSLVEGATLGIENTFANTLLLFIAIIAHKGSASFALAITLLRYQLSLLRIYTLVILFSCMTPLGIALGTLIETFSVTHQGAWVSAIFNAFAAGSFIYIATLLHIRFHEHEQKDNVMTEYASLVMGTAFMAAIAYIV